jgi:hypothetical protein
MKKTALIGVILIVLGILGVIQGGITYYRNRNVVDLGGVRIQVDEVERLPLSPILGAAAILAGVYLLYEKKPGRDGQR